MTLTISSNFRLNQIYVKASFVARIIFDCYNFKLSVFGNYGLVSLQLNEIGRIKILVANVLLHAVSHNYKISYIAFLKG